MPGIIGVNKAKRFGHITTDMALNVMDNLCNMKTYTHYLGTGKILFTGHTEHKTPQTSIISAKDLGQYNLGTPGL